MNYEIIGDEVVNIEQVKTATQVVTIKTHYCWTKKLVISCKNEAKINAPITVTVFYYDWQNNPLPEENRPIRITVTGPGKVQDLILIPTNGQAEFDFISEIPGTFKIQATAEFPCEPAEIEVVVS